MVKPLPKPENTVSTAEAARTLYVDRHTVTSWLRNGKLRGTKEGKLWRVDKDSLQMALQHVTDFFGCTEPDCAWGCRGWDRV